jgi:hypothetical protein
MIAGLTDGCELDHLTACIETGESFKRELLKKAGFAKIADLTRQIVVGEEAFDMEMWRKHF